MFMILNLKCIKQSFFSIIVNISVELEDPPPWHATVDDVREYQIIPMFRRPGSKNRVHPVVQRERGRRRRRDDRDEYNND
jgi:hypothetical protein